MNFGAEGRRGPGRRRRGLGLRGAQGRPRTPAPRAQCPRAASRPPRDGGAWPGSGSMLQVPAPAPATCAQTDSTKRGRRAPREPRKEGTPGWTRKRRRGGQGPHAPDPLLRGRGTDVKPCPRVATQAGTSKPPPRHSPWRAASKPFPEEQIPKHDPKQTRWTHRAPGVTPAPLAAEAGGARGRDP